MNICNMENVTDEIKAASGCGGAVAGLDNVVLNIVQAVILVLGVVAVIFVVIGGVNYMTSAGDTQKVEKAKKTILYAVIGLAVCALSFAIVNWAIGAIESTPATGQEETDEGGGKEDEKKAIKCTQAGDPECEKSCKGDGFEWNKKEKTCYKK